jgi:hypothetical protein
MTRDEALALYRPIRASVRGILSAGVPVCNQADLMRAAKQLGLGADRKIVLPESGEAAEMPSGHCASSSRTSAGGAHWMLFPAKRRGAAGECARHSDERYRQCRRTK